MGLEEEMRGLVGFSDMQKDQTAAREAAERRQAQQQLGATFDRYSVHGSQVAMDAKNTNDQILAYERAGAEGAALASMIQEDNVAAKSGHSKSTMLDPDKASFIDIDGMDDSYDETQLGM